MLADGAPWKGKARRAFAALVLTLLSGVSTAAYAGYALSTAWTVSTRCNPPPPGYSCTYTSFWGFGPTEFLLASIAGIATGLLTAVVGWELHRRAFSVTRGTLAIVALSIAGLVAYGGFGVGVVTGIAGGLLFSSLRPRRSRAPSEWSGSLPPGVPPVKAAPRPMTERPSVSEWDGVSMPASTSSAAPEKQSLPSADRLAAALARSRLSTPPTERPAESRRAFVLLPPPPSGIPGRTAAPSTNLPRGPSPSPTAAPRRETVRPPAPKPSPPPVASVPRPGPPAPTVAPASRPPSPTSPAVREYDPRQASPPALPRPTSSANRAPVSGSAAPRAGAPPRAPARPSSPGPSPNLPAGAAPAAAAPKAAAPPPAPAPVSASPAGTPAPSRLRAWVCPGCRLVNAPWSTHCTRCRTAAPPSR